MKPPISPLKTIRRHATGSRVDRAVKGIVLVKDWFPKGANGSGFVHTIYDGFFVVATWHEYSDGHTITVEGGTTHAICHDLDLAKTIYSTFT